MMISVREAFTDQDHHWMSEALLLAEKAESEGEVPVGAVVVLDNQCVGRGWNQPIRSLDPTAHAEITALREAAKNIGNYRLINATLYVTLEPCLMCTGSLIQARIKRLVFGAFDSKAGAIESVCKGLDIPCNHRFMAEGGLLAEPCGQLLTNFFRARR